MTLPDKNTADAPPPKLTTRQQLVRQSERALKLQLRHLMRRNNARARAARTPKQLQVIRAALGRLRAELEHMPDRQ